MPGETCRYLITRRDGVYLDMTCGGGGHLKIISERLSGKAMLIGIDRDSDAIKAARKNLKAAPQTIKIINSRFSEVDRVLKEIQLNSVDGVLIDAGVSSHQIDSPDRGFSFMQSGVLDMRMSRDDSLTAETVVNEYPEERLTEIFRMYGEEKKAKRVSQTIIQARRQDRLRTTDELLAVLRPLYPGRDINSTMARLFQAIRIEVNGELDELSNALPKAFDLLVSGGRLVCISYHSLEDRIVKRFMAEKAKGCICPDNFPVCTCGRKPEVELLTRKVVRPSAEEIESNSRARSARLRAAARI